MRARARGPGSSAGGEYSLPRPPALGEPERAAEGHGEGHDGLDGLMQLANASSQEDLAPALPDPSAAAAPGSSMSLRTRTSSRRARASRAEWAAADDDDNDDAPMRDGELELALPVPPAPYNPYSLDPPPPHLAMRAGMPPSGAGGYAGGGAAQAHDDDPDYLPSPPPGLAGAAPAVGPSGWPYAYELPSPGAAQAGPSGASSSSAPHPNPNPRQALGQRLSALDVLAQATAEMDHEGLAGVVDHGRGLYEGGWQDGAQGGKGGGKAGVPSSRSRVPTVGPDGQKKPRSPYIKVRRSPSPLSISFSSRG